MTACALSLLALPSFGFCLQPNPSLTCEFLNSDAVFVGTVLSAREMERHDEEFEGWIYRLKVREWFRGTHTTTVEVFTENDSGRYEQNVGKEYLLFARKHSGGLQIGNCGNSAPFPKAEPTVEKLRKLKIPTNAVVEGRVSFSGIPDNGVHVPGVQIVVRSPHTTFKTTTDRDGWFHLNVPQGRYSAEVRPFPHWDIVPYDLSHEDPAGFDARGGHCSSLQFIAKAK